MSHVSSSLWVLPGITPHNPQILELGFTSGGHSTWDSHTEEQGSQVCLTLKPKRLIIIPHLCDQENHTHIHAGLLLQVDVHCAKSTLSLKIQKILREVVRNSVFFCSTGPSGIIIACYLSAHLTRIHRGWRRSIMDGSEGRTYLPPGMVSNFIRFVKKEEKKRAMARELSQ